MYIYRKIILLSVLNLSMWYISFWDFFPLGVFEICFIPFLITVYSSPLCIMFYFFALFEDTCIASSFFAIALQFFVLHNQFLQLGYEVSKFSESLYVWRCPFVYLVGWSFSLQSFFLSLEYISFLAKKIQLQFSVLGTACFIFLEALRNFLLLVFWNVSRYWMFSSIFQSFPV